MGEEREDSVYGVGSLGVRDSKTPEGTIQGR